MKTSIYLFSTFIFFILLALLSCDNNDPEDPDKKNNNDDPYLLIGEKNFLSGYEPIAGNGYINMIVEIPTGTNQKWEVNDSTGYMEWEFSNGKPRVVNYLSYMANYGLIPKTLLPFEAGGDGDPLDVIVLGPAIERGSLVKCKLVGIMRLIDRGEQDEKLIAVAEDSPFSGISTFNELNESYPGVIEIIKIWFTNYKGPSVKMEVKGFGNETTADSILNIAINAYKEKNAN